MSKTRDLRVTPMGISTNPACTIFPTTENIAVPGLLFVPIPLNHFPPFSTMGGIDAKVLTLFITVGFPHKPLWAGNGGLGCGIPLLP